MKWAAWLACVACVHEAAYVSPTMLEREHGKLAAGEHVTVYATDGRPYDVGPELVVELVTTDGKHIPMRIDALVRDCPDTPDEPDKLCRQTGLQSVIVGHHRHLNDTVDTVLRGTVVLGILVGLPVCSFECSSPYNYISDGVLVVGGLAVVVGLYILARNFSRPMT